MRPRRNGLKELIVMVKINYIGLSLVTSMTATLDVSIIVEVVLFIGCRQGLDKYFIFLYHKGMVQHSNLRSTTWT